jgi:phage terminase small subunit
MKINKKNIIVSSILGLTLISSSFNLVNAQELTTQPESKYEQQHPNCKMMHRKSIFKESVESLEVQGVLTQDDVKNIKEYCKQQMIKKEKEKSIERVEQMVKDNIITKEKGEKLKDAINSNKSE